ncbi:MAG: hypothetical protein Hyperionvirus1_135 [Hyperionvirus sp.]|uniref:Uncharacterized protein n=1 Tax=Hyperionvirus sp. TaxID=2487770 RepID=A0A3G5A5N7_9VIRU|nr:MAG: hypothetical protein Hyperionvirus1_135 [Hyperionvirus sp.]
MAGLKVLSLSRVCEAVLLHSRVSPVLVKHLKSRFTISYDENGTVLVTIKDDQFALLEYSIEEWQAEWNKKLIPSKTLRDWIEAKTSRSLPDLLKEISLEDKSRSDSYMFYEPDELMEIVSRVHESVYLLNQERTDISSVQFERKRRKDDLKFMEQFVESAKKQLMNKRATQWKWWAVDDNTKNSELDEPVAIEDLYKYIPGSTVEPMRGPNHLHQNIILHVVRPGHNFFIKFTSNDHDKALRLESASATKKKDSDQLIANDLAQKIRSGRIYPTLQSLKADIKN